MVEDRSWAGLEAGTIVSHYEIVESLGRGGMGVVYRARDLNLERSVAIKTPWPWLASDPKIRERFLREGRAASRLSHPHIVHVFETFECDGVPYIAMELVEGANLGQRIRRTGPPPIDEILQYAVGLADALRAAHAKGILHRDIKPANILIDEDGRARLTDFGLVRFFVPEGEEPSTAPNESLTSSGIKIGTLAYMAPEHLLGRPLSPASDLFSLGAVLYETCTGVVAFTAGSDGDVLNAVLHGEPQAIERLNYAIPAELIRIVRKCLSKRPDERYQSARELTVDLRALERALASGGPTVELGSRPTPLRVWRSRVVGALLFAAGALAVWWIVDARAPKPPAAFGRPTQVTRSPGWEAEPAVSPDGSLVAYTSMRSTAPDVWLVDTHGGDPLALTDHPAADHSPSWYPDGSAVAFVSDRSGMSSVWKVPPLGGSPVLVVPDAFDPAVSPEGRRIAFSRSDSSGRLRVHVAPLADPSAAVAITGDDDGFWWHTQPAWSPDGAEICYASFDDLRIVPATGGASRKLTSSASRPVWSPDGAWIYFESWREGTQALWRISVDGGEPVRLTLGTGPESHPSLSADGGRLAYTTYAGSTSIALLDREAGKLTLLPAVTTETGVTLAPDNGSMVFASDRRGRFDLWLQPLSGIRPDGPPRKLTDQDGVVNLPSFSPDGRYVAYLRILDDERDIWIAPLEGDLPRPFVTHPATDTQPAWSPAGSRIAFVSDRDGRYHVWTAPVRDGAPAGDPVQVTRGDWNAAHPSWSPAGDRLAFIGDRDGARDGARDVWVIDASEPSGATRVTWGARASLASWDGADGLIVSGSWDTERTVVRRVTVSTGEVEEFDPPIDFGSANALGEFAVSVDGRLLTFIREQQEGDVWILDQEGGDDVR